MKAGGGWRVAEAHSGHVQDRATQRLSMLKDARLQLKTEVEALPDDRCVLGKTAAGLYYMALGSTQKSNPLLGCKIG